MNITLHDLSKKRVEGYEKKGFKLLSVCTSTVLSACAEYSDDEGFLPDDRMLVMGSNVGDGIYEFLLFDTSQDTQE